MVSGLEKTAFEGSCVNLIYHEHQSWVLMHSGFRILKMFLIQNQYIFIEYLITNLLHIS